jgi:hypothetical protein
MGADILRTFNILALWTVLLWTVYPIIWGVSEGGNVIAPDSEAVAYGVLDLLTKRKSLWPSKCRPVADQVVLAVFGAVLIWGLRNVDLARLGMDFNDTNPNSPRGIRGIRGIKGHKTEKEAEAAAAGEGVAPPAAEHTPETTV